MFEMRHILFLLFSVISLKLFAVTLHVGQNYPYKTITQATVVAQPGDIILCHDVTMQGGMSVSNLKGNENSWIIIKAEQNITVTIQGGSNSIQFSDCEYLHIEGFIFQGQTGNGLNIDDAGSIESPTHHIKIVNCSFQNCLYNYKYNVLNVFCSSLNFAKCIYLVVDLGALVNGLNCRHSLAGNVLRVYAVRDLEV